MNEFEEFHDFLKLEATKGHFSWPSTFYKDEIECNFSSLIRFCNSFMRKVPCPLRLHFTQLLKEKRSLMMWENWLGLNIDHRVGSFCYYFTIIWYLKVTSILFLGCSWLGGIHRWVFWPQVLFQYQHQRTILETAKKTTRKYVNYHLANFSVKSHFKSINHFTIFPLGGSSYAPTSPKPDAKELSTSESKSSEIPTEEVN